MIIELDKYQKIRSQQREAERENLMALVVVEAFSALKGVDDKDFDYVIGHLTEFIRDIGESYSELPGRSLNALKAFPDIYKSRKDITAELKAKAFAIYGGRNEQTGSGQDIKKH